MALLRRWPADAEFAGDGQRQHQNEPEAPKPTNLALQGGGSHGAFTWGVLDYLLEDGRLDFAAISGASAGAMNAVVLAEGFIDKGREGAREALDAVLAIGERRWRAALAESRLFDIWFSAFGLNAAAKFWTDALTHYASPYEFNPLNLNPLRDHLAELVDFEKLRRTDGLKLFIAATNVRTGPGAHFPPRRTRRRSRDGLGVPAAIVSGGHD